MREIILKGKAYQEFFIAIFPGRLLRRRTRKSNDSGRESLLFIARLIEDEVRPMTQRNRAISTEEQLVIALRFFASGSFLQVIGDTHGYDKATVSRIVRRVSLALANKHETWVKFPTRMEDKNAIRAGMYEIAGFPCVIGCIDCTHIRIQTPSRHEPNYVKVARYSFQKFRCSTL